MPPPLPASVPSTPIPASVHLFHASSAWARPDLPFHPCKTLLISTSSVSFHPNRPEFFAVVTEVREFRPKSLPIFPDNPQFGPHRFVRSPDDQTLIRCPSLSLGSTASFRDRSIDLLSLFVAADPGSVGGAASGRVGRVSQRAE